jgi:tetrahydromethanopterin S-methyltransferase subunit A
MEIIKAEQDPSCKKIRGKYEPKKDLNLDSAGYFLIRINYDKNEIEAAFCRRKNIIELIVHGKTAEEIYHTFIIQGIKIKPEHAAYLGKELEKAEICMMLNIQYIQDKPFEIEKVMNSKVN